MIFHLRDVPQGCHLNLCMFAGCSDNEAQNDEDALGTEHEAKHN